MRRLFGGLFFALALDLSVPASAQGLLHEIRFGVLAHDVPIFSSNSPEDGVVLNFEVAFRPSFEALGGRIRPVIGASIATSNAISLFYVDARWEWTYEKFFFALGLGIAVHNGNLERQPNGKKALGSRWQLHPGAEIGLQFTPRHRLSLYYEHASNSSRRQPNPGLDNLGARVSYRF